MGSGCSRAKNQPTIEYNKSMFQQLQIVGKGGFGKVWRVLELKTKKIFALKIIDKAKVITKKSVSSVINQRQILSILLQDESNFIVNMRQSFQDKQNLYLLMDYLQAGDLRYYVNHSYNFAEEQISTSLPDTEFVVRCVIQGLKHLHLRNIIHRDVKPENIIVDKHGYCRITDLGIARYWKPQNAHETSGTPGYMAPEVLLRQNHSFCTDYYAVGIIAYELFVGKRPYSGRDRKSIRDEMLVRQAKLPINLYGRVSKQGIDFVNRLLLRSTRKRLGYSGINEIISHPWLQLKQEARQQFQQRQLKSPLIPLQISYNRGLEKDTEPDDIWRQNILMLKRKETQKLFEFYDYNPALNSKRTAGTESSTI